MVIKETRIRVDDLIRGYRNNEDTGVVAFNGSLDVRPPYQREFVYDDVKQRAVIDTILKGYPLNIMYWGKTGAEGDYELIDGQQRTISICSFARGDFHIILNGEKVYYVNLTDDQKRSFKNYELTVYICDGDASEKLEWFKTINISGMQLTDQELRNAVYTGSWLYDAKRRFSKQNCIAMSIAKQYMRGDVIRQDYLETVLSWIADRDHCSIEDYMHRHCNDANASDLWDYFESVINWLESLFATQRKEMKGLPWGIFYNRYHETPIGKTPAAIEREIKALLLDDDVTKKSGVYEYLLGGDERCLSIRKFSENMKREAYEKQNGMCAKCGKYFDYEETEADHIKPWSEGGKTNVLNCQILCKQCNRMKSDK